MVDSLSLVYLPLAVGLGALHALEPGHSKTLMAAYLIGTKGTKRDAIALGLSAAATHSIIVIALAVTALWLGREAFTESVSHYLQIGSGSLVILLGLWMIWSRRSSLFAHHAHHHHAPDPIEIAGPLATGKLEIIETPAGERLQLKTLAAVENLQATVVITREGRFETIPLQQTDDPTLFISDVAPEEPHTFDAILTLQVGDRREANPFTMQEPAEHGHEHLSEDAHARAHAAAMPAYVNTGQRPSLIQVIGFGAAGGMIPCPASVTVMLLALSIGKVALGVLAVLCFSIGLAIALVGIGLIVVLGISRLSHTGRFSWLTSRAPLVSAGVVVLSGISAILFAH